MSLYSIFGAKIQPKFTNDSKNVLKVSCKKEIFFDVFECQLNGKNIVVEKTGQYENTPIVKFEIKDEGKVFNCEALLVIDKENDLYLNENNLEFSKNIKVPIVEKTIVEEVKKIIPNDTLHEEKVQNISDKIVAKSEEKARLIQEAKLKEYQLKQEQIIEQSENYLNGKFDNYIKENIHALVTDSNLVYDKLVENLNNLDDGEIKDILGERVKRINEELNHQLKNEVTSMKKYVEMSSGGGTNAKQYANGGRMIGDLEVTGKITAGTIAGSTELNGGTIDGNLAVTGSINADTITVTTLLSATQVDFVRETNGFIVDGPFTVNTSTFKVDSANNRVGIGTATPGAGAILGVVGDSRFNGNVTLNSANKALIKENCYFKSGGIRLRKGSLSAEEMSMRYESSSNTNNNFVIQQISGGNNKGQIKFIPGQNVLRLDCNRVELGTLGDTVRALGNTEIGVPTTNSSQMLKLTFRDSRTQAHGLHFEHSGANTQVIQMGMYGEYPNADKGDFKITSKTGSNAVQDILTVDNLDQGLTVHKNTSITGNVTVTDTISAGNIVKADFLNIGSGKLFVSNSGSANNKYYTKMGDYGEGNFFGNDGSVNGATFSLGVGSAGKIVEDMRIDTFALSGAGLVNKKTNPVVLVTSPGANKYIVPVSIQVYKSQSGGTRVSWPTGAGATAFGIGTFANSANTGVFSGITALPRTTAIVSGDWLYTRNQGPDTTNRIISNRDLCLRGFDDIASNASTDVYYLKVRYMVMSEDGDFKSIANLQIKDT